MIDDSDVLASLITREVVIEDLRVQMAYEQSLTTALINLRTRPVPGLDEESIERTTGIALSSSLAAARRLVDDALSVVEAEAVDALTGLEGLRRSVDGGQSTRDEVVRYFDSADGSVQELSRVLLARMNDLARRAGADAVTQGIVAWTDHLDAVHLGIEQVSGLFALLAPDARWQSATSRYEFAGALSGFDRSLGALDASVPDMLRAEWSLVRESPALTEFESRQADLVSLAGLGRPGDPSAIDVGARLTLLAQANDVVLGVDAFRPTLDDFLMHAVTAQRADARRVMQVGAVLVAVAFVCSLLLLLSANRAIVIPLRRLEAALAKLRGGASGVPVVDVGGTSEIAAAGYAFRDLVGEVALVEAQAAAIGAGDLQNPVLAETTAMSIGRSLRQSVQTLSTMSAQLRSREETAKSVLETAADAIWTIDGDALIRSANRATEDLLGWPASEVMGAHFGSLLATEADMVVFELLRQQGSVRSEVQLRRANGTTMPALVSAAVTYFEGNLMVTVVARDIAERKELEGRLAHQATHDTLTGLANRGAAIAHLEQVLTRAEVASTDTALLFIDLDRFKLVNDSHGHRGGDELLAKVAERLRSLSSVNILPARLGGDEFVIILGDAGTIDVAVRLGQQAISAIEQSYEMDNATHSISASVGVSYVAAGRSSALGMLRDADHAVYQAKQRGGRCVQVFDDVLRDAVEMRARTEMDLRRAIERNELVLYYQPILDASTGALRGAEALVRWQHPTRGLVFPDTFIPLAEESMLIVDLGRWVMRAAMEQVSQWQNMLGVPAFSVSVNLSGRHIVDSDVVADVKYLLEQTNADPRRIKVEVTESRLIAEMDSSVRAFQRLRELGVSISIDDFGTGYSGFTNVRSFPIDQVKIDRSFVKHLGVRHQDTAIVETVINLARAFGIDVVAEGVETDEQRLLLVERSCDLIQGWLVAPAMPLDAFSEWMVRVLPEIQHRFAGGTPLTVAR